MAILRPFRALRPVPELAKEIAAVPYDVVNREEAAALAKGQPRSFLHISRAEIDLAPSVNPYSQEVYSRAHSNLSALIREESLLTESKPCLYIYRLIREGRSQTGIAATFSIDEYENGTIKKHEKTRKDKEDDRTRHVVTLEAQTGPVFLAYRGNPKIQSWIAQATRETPLYDFVAPDGVTHTLWRVEDTSPLVSEFKNVPSLYIADGHHRAASAWRARAELREKNPAHTGQESYNFFLAVAFAAEELRILPYFRAVRDLGRFESESEFLTAIEERFELTQNASSHPKAGSFGMYLGGKWWGLRPKATTPVASAAFSAISVTDRLDVSVLQNSLLAPLLGVQDPRTDQRIEFVGGVRGTSELEQLVNTGKASVAFSLFPTTMEDLMAVSDAGQMMPPKSTWFEPKLRDGLVSHWIQESWPSTP